MKFKTILFIICITITGAISYSVFHLITSQNSLEFNLRTNAAAAITPTATIAPTPTGVPADGLKTAVKEVLSGPTGTYGVAVKNLKTGESYYMDEHKVFEPASLYKLWVMGTVFQQIEAGKLKEDNILSQDIPVLNDKFDIDPELAEQTEGKITLKVSDALDQMIDYSANYAALLLAERLRNANIQNYLAENGFDESSLGEPPQTTPYDIVLFLEKLYKGELADAENTQRMIEILKKQTLNNKIPKYLPAGLTIAHKTGEIGSFSHDAGIVFTDKGDYIIVVMTESDIPADAEERISAVSKSVYDYFEKTF